MACFVLIAIILFTFKKYRSDYRTFYDAAFCASMAFHMMFYYMALNFPESLETNGDVKKRNTFSCALILMLHMTFLTFCFGWMTAGAFWQMALLKIDGSEEEEEAGRVRFADGPTEPHRVRVLRNLNNQIMTVVVAAGLCIPVVYLILEIVIPKTFMVDDRRCWVSSTLMFVCMLLPCILCTASSMGFLVWTGWKVDPKQGFSLHPEDPKIRDLQIRLFLTLALGIIWCVEIPVLGNTGVSPGPIQHFKGLLYIPLSILCFYIFVYRVPDVIETWDNAVPLGARFKKWLGMVWKYDIKRPAQRQMIRMKSKRSQHLSAVSPSSEGSRQPTLQLQEPDYQYDVEITTAQNGYQSEDNNTFDGSNTSHVNASAEDQHQGTAENLYQVNLPPSETYDEFEAPNIYMNNSSDEATPVAYEQPLVITTQPTSSLAPPIPRRTSGSTQPEILPVYDTLRDSPLYDNPNEARP